MSISAERGEAAENRVQRTLELKGYSLIRKRWRTPYAEIDLLMGKERELLLIEVKTMSCDAFAQYRISPNQKMRLRRAQMFIQSRSPLDVRLIFAFVEPNGQILLFNPGEDDLH